MAVPKRKTSPSKRNMRRSHHALKPANYQECKQCGELHLPHNLCPACKQFEELFGTYLDDLPSQGVQVVYHPVTILDDKSDGTRYSSRAASAVACVAEQDDDDLTQTKAFFDLLFLNQPAGREHPRSRQCRPCGLRDRGGRA